MVLTLAETDGTDLIAYDYPLPFRENNTCRSLLAPAGYRFYESDESAKTPDGTVIQLSVERASCRSEKMAKRVFEQMLDRYDLMKDKTPLAVPGFDEVLHWGGEPGRIGWYFVRSGNQAVFSTTRAEWKRRICSNCSPNISPLHSRLHNHRKTRSRVPLFLILFPTLDRVFTRPGPQ